MAVSWMDPSTSPWFPHADGMTGAPRPQRDEGPVLVTADDVARTYGVAKRTVYYWAQTGALPSVRVGGSVRFDPDAVAKFMAPDDRPSEHVFATPSAVAPAIEAEGIVWAHGAARLSSAEAAEGVASGRYFVVDPESARKLAGTEEVLAAHDARQIEALAETLEAAVRVGGEQLARLRAALNAVVAPTPASRKARR